MKKIVKVLLILNLLFALLIPQIVIYATDKQEENADYENYSEAYKQYLQLSDEEKAKIDVIPRKYDVPLDTIYENTTEVKEEEKLTNLFGLFAKTYRVASNAESLPDKFDLRDKINIYVRNQQSYGLCWDFASTKCLETYLALNNCGEYDFSELHVDYLMSSEFNETRELHSGGNFKDYKEYVQSGYGPVLEEECPYNKIYTTDEFEYLVGLKPKAYILDTKSFPTIDKINQNYSEEDLKLFRDTVKKHIMENGSVYTMLSTQETITYGDKNIYSTFQSFSRDPHAMSVIGWDDNYSKDNFKDQNGKSPKHDGAYIVVNSWGESYNDKGFLYVSYDDYWIEMSMEGITKATTDVNELNNIEHENLYKKIKFEDENLYNAIKEILGRKIFYSDDSSKTIYIKEEIISKLLKLDLHEKNITDLSGIENFTSLQELNLSHNNISNIDNIIELTKKQTTYSLNKLDLSYNNIENISEKLNHRFNELDLSSNNIKDASNLCNLELSRTINLSRNPLESGMQELFSCWRWGVYLDDCALESLDFSVINEYDGKVSLRNNNISNASFLQNMWEGHIDLSGNVNLDISSLPLNNEVSLTLENCNISNLESLIDYNGQTLDISDNPISNLNVFDDWENPIANINKIDLSNTNVADISALHDIEKIDLSKNKNLTGLNNLTYVKELSLENCELTSIPEIGSNRLETFDVNYNNIEDVTRISNYTKLKSLSLSNNNISDISPLQGLTTLEFLDLSNNKVVDIYALSNKDRLYKLDLSNNLIEDVSIYKNSTLYVRGDGTYINLNGNKIKDIEDVKKFWEHYSGFMQEEKEKQKITNQHLDIDVEFLVNEENNITLPNIFIDGYEKRFKNYKETGKITQIEVQNCEINHENNTIKITPSEIGNGVASLKIIGGIYDGTIYTINYNAKDENESEYEIQVSEGGITGYIEGENFNPTGTKITKVFPNGGFEKEITDYTIDNGTNLQIGQENVTVKYGDKETLLPINVYNSNEVKLLKFNDEGLYKFMTRLTFSSNYYKSEIDNRIIVSNEVFETKDNVVFHGDSELVTDFTGLSQLNLKRISFDDYGGNIDSFIDEIVKIPNLEELSIKNYSKAKNVSAVASLTNLKKLYINGEKTDGIIDWLNLSNLEDLEIHCNETIRNIDEVSKKKMLPKFLREIKEKYPETTITAEEETANGKTEKQINIDSNGDYYIYLNNEIYIGKEQEGQVVAPRGGAGDFVTVKVLLSGGIADGSQYILRYTPTGNNSGIEYEVINEQKYITQLSTETNIVKDVLTIDNFPNENYTKQARDKSGKLLTDNDKLGTGSTIEILNSNGEPVETYKIAIKGDIDGTGEIDLYDVLALIELVFDTDSTYQWEECIKFAGKCTENSTSEIPNIYDILRLIEYHFDGVKW